MESAFHSRRKATQRQKHVKTCLHPLVVLKGKEVAVPVEVEEVEVIGAVAVLVLHLCRMMMRMVKAMYQHL